ncbi:lactate racemase domain-containing protein [Ammoniphilus sp. CFH 90114]|uniref:lactate racemase domain-containing protein n=1 Tax=Ammoniphilus sp. CFH 90114 TaxID=2493665 RepID=UPI001F0C40EF|nr:lactate racemase domain-containing protein [Ammoniphilus sp. CFH 90114]
MYLVEQPFNKKKIENITETVKNELARFKPHIKPGMRLALPSGSRGFPYGVEVMKVLADTFRSWGADPFIIPAMGSHGGGTAEGQIKVLENLGISEQTIGIPVCSSMEVVHLGQTPSGVDVYCDRLAFEAEGIFIYNRIKPHTAFRAPIESGLSKMLAVGLGKKKGAETLHRAGLGAHIVEAARLIREKTRFIGGLAIVDNPWGEALEMKAARPDEMEEIEEQLLKLAWENIPLLPYDHLHVLIIDYIGKDISGSGMDVNVVGMHRRLGGTPTQHFETIVALDLTLASKGNALGIGYADITTRELVDKINMQAIMENAIATGFLGTAKIPVTMPSKQAAIDLAVRLHSTKDLRVARIKNTKYLQQFWISEALFRECDKEGKLRSLGVQCDLHEIKF